MNNISVEFEDVYH